MTAVRGLRRRATARLQPCAGALQGLGLLRDRLPPFGAPAARPRSPRRSRSSTHAAKDDVRLARPKPLLARVRIRPLRSPGGLQRSEEARKAHVETFVAIDRDRSRGAPLARRPPSRSGGHRASRRRRAARPRRSARDRAASTLVTAPRFRPRPVAARSPAIRSDSLIRRSATPAIVLVPAAKAAAIATSGISSIDRNARSAPTPVGRSGRHRTAMSASGSPQTSARASQLDRRAHRAADASSKPDSRRITFRRRARRWRCRA